MGASWGKLLTKLKHIKVKHKAVSAHLIRGGRGREESGSIKTYSIPTEQY